MFVVLHIYSYAGEIDECTNIHLSMCAYIIICWHVCLCPYASCYSMRSRLKFSLYIDTCAIPFANGYSWRGFLEGVLSKYQARVCVFFLQNQCIQHNDLSLFNILLIGKFLIFEATKPCSVWIRLAFLPGMLHHQLVEWICGCSMKTQRMLIDMLVLLWEVRAGKHFSQSPMDLTKLLINLRWTAATRLHGAIEVSPYLDFKEKVLMETAFLATDFLLPPGVRSGGWRASSPDVDWFWSKA